jgi:hypothetical protein
MQQRPSADAISQPGDVIVRRAIQNVIQARATAHEAGTLARLKAINPEVNDEDLKFAIKRAVQLDSDCARNFAYQSPDYFDDCKRAVELSRIENPGFSDETFKQAEQYLMFIMR